MPKKSRSSRRKEPTSRLLVIAPENLLETSVIYQDIFQKGYEHGVRKGYRKVLKRRMEFLFGKRPDSISRRLTALNLQQLETLSDVLLEFQTKDDLI
jgi:Domain of unknown function (DUF4351)